MANFHRVDRRDLSAPQRQSPKSKRLLLLGPACSRRNKSFSSPNGISSSINSKVPVSVISPAAFRTSSRSAVNGPLTAAIDRALSSHRHRVTRGRTRPTRHPSTHGRAGRSAPKAAPDSARLFSEAAPTRCSSTGAGRGTLLTACRTEPVAGPGVRWCSPRCGVGQTNGRHSSGTLRYSFMLRIAMALNAPPVII
jgi:hypothetical protein